jgi:hypothetical protein
MYTKEDADRILCAKRRKRHVSALRVCATKLCVLESWFALKDNRICTLASLFDMPEKWIHDTINEWLETGHLTVESKL